MPIPVPTLPFSRRLFMGAASAGLVAAAGPANALEQIPDKAIGRPQPVLQKKPPIPESEKLGFAVVGLGQLALGEILPAFAESRMSKLVALVSGNPEKAKKTAARSGVRPDAIYDYGGFDRIAQDDRIDVVYIVLPNALHADFTVRALKAGKHVLCEKPMAVSVEQCRQMIAAAEQAKRKLMIAYRAQYEPYSLDAMRRIRSGELGDLQMISTDNGRTADPSDPADQWRLLHDLAGGGSLMDIGIYGLNGARYLSGEEPAEVRAQIFNRPDDHRFAQVEDVVAWQLRMPSGLIVNSSCGYSYERTSRFDVLGTKARLTMDPATEYHEHKTVISTGGAKNQPQIMERNQFAAEMDHLANAIKEGRPVKSPGEEGMQDIRLMMAIYDAAKTGQPVKTDWRYVRAVDVASTDSPPIYGN